MSIESFDIGYVEGCLGIHGAVAFSTDRTVFRT